MNRLYPQEPPIVNTAHTSPSSVERWIEEGNLVRSEGSTSVSLARTMSMLSNDPKSENRSGDPHVTELAEAIGEYQHYLFILIDGLGINQRTLLPAGGFFESNLDRTIRSVFPSTTAAALTSLASGEWPASHAITGWFTRIPNYEATVIPLRGVERETDRPIDDFSIPYADIMCVESSYPRYQRAVDIYTFRKFRTGHFADWYRDDIEITTYRNLTNATRRIRRGTARHVRKNTPSFAYVYFSQVDHLSHAHGRKSDEVVQEIAATDAALTALRSDLPKEVRMIVTADHGHIDIPGERHYLLNHDDPLMKLLECPPSGEARIPLFHVKPGKESEFASAFATRSNGEFVLITPDEADAMSLYGPEPLSLETKRRLGTFIGISSEADAIEYVSEGRTSVGHIGMHGGMSADEVEVPLFLA